MCDSEYPPNSPFCMQRVDGAASLPGGIGQHLSHHPPYSQLILKDSSWCFVLELQPRIEFETLLYIFMVGNSLGDQLLQHLHNSGQNSSCTCKVFFSVSGNQRILL